MNDYPELFIEVFKQTCPEPYTLPSSSEEALKQFELNKEKLKDAVWLEAQARSIIGIADRETRIKLCQERVAQLKYRLQILLIPMTVQHRSLCWIRMCNEKVKLS